MKKISLLLFLLTLCVAAAAQNQRYDWAAFGRYEDSNKTVAKKPHAVFMGDSITEGWARIDSDFFSSNNFIGRGISGQTTSHMLVRFRRDVLDLSPEYVVIMAGTNDIALNNGYISLENILGNLQSMCELAKLHKVKPILCSVPPAAAFSWRKELRPADDVVRLNEMLRKYAKSARIPYVDYHSVLKDDNNGLPEKYAADGVHPNIECYRIMEEIILEYLK